MNATNCPDIKWGSVMLDCDNPEELAEFYAKLLGGEVNTMPFTDEWAEVKLPDTSLSICFQKEPLYKRPVWPAVDGSEQQMMTHLDFTVKNREEAVAFALSLGATMPSEQFCPPDWPHPWTTLLDPAGHPFCLTQI